LTRRDNQLQKHHLRATPKAAILNPLRHTITIQIDAQFSSSLSRYRAGSETVGLRFLPVEIVKDAPVTRPMPVAENRIEIELSGGHRMRISGSYDPEALARLIRGLTA
jgi:hypothetical protein